ncbi:hypothetical protein HOLleu_15973 [Holothuria leucospilota]|uniref:Uncharacterized protein n=1 Tax=Holothuria leucospilota TaxID=206669 RepID=A0A9Q1C3F1_HOLLE|nr:hypothetical protein HOLleu_15973 [Holothuria leucospilota]
MNLGRQNQTKEIHLCSTIPFIWLKLTFVLSQAHFTQRMAIIKGMKTALFETNSGEVFMFGNTSRIQLLSFERLYNETKNESILNTNKCTGRLVLNRVEVFTQSAVYRFLNTVRGLPCNVRPCLLSSLLSKPGI